MEYALKFSQMNELKVPYVFFPISISILQSLEKSAELYFLFKLCVK